MAAALKKVCKCIKTIAFLSAVLSVRAVCAEQKGVFLHPNDNAYALDKILTRPYLQSVPIREVWRSGAIGDDLAYYLLDYNVPVQNEEIQAEAHFWKVDALERDFEFADTKRDTNQSVDFIADFSSSAYPELDAQAVDFIKQIDRADLDVTNMTLDYESKKEMVRDADALADFNRGRTGRALIDVVFAQLDAAMRPYDRKVEAALAEKKNDVLDDYAANPDKYFSETALANLRKNYDMAVLGMLTDDLTDLKTMVDVSAQDAADWAKLDLGLDSSDFSAKIQSEKQSEQKRLLKLIRDVMEREGKK
ncbi:MAG TPA: hypothetical protein DD624_03230 [Alphaproteobacteria bacterium]|nr:hypothetical protein [Alphaproteobacteria bacterium]